MDPSVAHEAFVAANQALKSTGVTYWMSYGTLLGAVREGDFLSHDSDIDFCCDEPEKYQAVHDAMIAAGFTLYHEFGSPDHGFEQAFKIGPAQLKVDVFYYYSDDDYLSQSAWWMREGEWWEIIHDFPKAIVYPIRPYMFRGLQTFAPGRPRRFLAHHYGPDWEIPDPEWDWRTDPRSIRPGTRPPGLKGRPRPMAVLKPPVISMDIPGPPPEPIDEPLDDVTVCIKTFLRDGYLFRCVESLERTYPEAQIVVVDDGHTDTKKEEWLEKRSGNFRYLTLPFDSGLSAGRNHAMEHVETSSMVLVDDDSVFDRQSRLPELVRLLDISDIACAAQIEAGQHDGTKGHFEAALFLEDGGLRIWPFVPEWRDHRGVRYTRTELGLNLFAGRTDAVRDLGWDEAFKIGYEHLDFFLRAKLAGLSVTYCPDALIGHRPPGVQVGDGYTSYRHGSARAGRDHFFAKHAIHSVANLSGCIDTI